LPFLRAAAGDFRAEGRLAPLAQALMLEAWAGRRGGGARAAITAAAEGVKLARETRQVRFGLVGQIAEAIAAVEMGADEAAERLVAEAEATLFALGGHPLTPQ